MCSAVLIITVTILLPGVSSSSWMQLEWQIPNFPSTMTPSLST